MKYIETSYQRMDRNFRDIRNRVFLRRGLLWFTVAMIIIVTLGLMGKVQGNRIIAAALCFSVISIFSFLSAWRMEEEMRKLWIARNRIAGNDPVPPFEYGEIAKLIND